MIIPRRKANMQPNELKKIIQYKQTDLSKNIVQQWESELASFLGRKHAIAVSSGRFGMKLIFEALNLKLKKEIIIPAYTLKDLIPIIESNKLIPIPADIDIHTFNISADTISKRINNNTGAVLATHMFGNPCPIDEIMALSEKNSLFVIEDCAHSIGSRLNNRLTGTFGHAAFFSFETIKPVNTYGGGMIVTDDVTIADYARKTIAECDQKNSITNKVIKAYTERFLFHTGLSFLFLYFLASPLKKMFTSFYRKVQTPAQYNKAYSEIQSVLGMEKLQTLQQRIQNKREKAEYLGALLNNYIKAQESLPGAYHNFYFFVSLIDEKPAVIRKKLLKHGIDAGILDEIADDCASYLNDVNCPNAQQVYNTAIHLPLYDDITDAHIEKIAYVLQNLIKHKINKGINTK